MISIIIVSYNTEHLLRVCLASLRIHSPNAQVIVVDNASSDGSVAMVRTEFPETRLVVLERNVGFAGGNNAGLPYANGEYVVLLNSDTFLEDDTLGMCEAWMQNNPRVGATSPVLLGIDGIPQNCFYAYPSLWRRLSDTLRVGQRPVVLEVSSGWIAGTCLFIRREALASVGGLLDSEFFIYWEDADFSCRLQKAGWEVVPCVAGHVRHYGGASGGGADALRRADLHAWYIYGEYRWYTKHRPAWQRLGLSLLDVMDIFRKCLRGLVRPSRRGDWRHAWVMAGVLARRVLGLRPPLPGGKRRGLKVPADVSSVVK